MSIYQKPIYAIILLVLSAFAEVNAGDFSIIINKNIRYSASDDEQRSFVRRLFLGKQKSWPGGVKAKPVNYKKGTEEYDAFLANVLHMTESDLDQHWASVRQKTGATPPSAVVNHRVIFKLIARSKGGISYISNQHLDELPDTVKVLFEF